MFGVRAVIPGRIERATRRLGAPRNWDKERDGPCCALAIRDEPTDAGPGMTSVWQPTPDELAKLAAGASIYLTILGTAHPPVSLAVGDAPEADHG